MRNEMIMKMAWNFAKKGAKRFGGSVKEYFAASLKLAWQLFKKALADKGGKIAFIQPWFLEKEFKHHSVVTTIKKSTYEIKKETEKAYLIIAKSFEHGVETVNKFWAPKSVCA